jgi:serine/threonine protein kinase
VECYLEGAHLAGNVYQADLAREMYQEILRIYRELARREVPRREVTGVLKSWFGRDGNWYKILGDLGAEQGEANVKIADFGISFRTADEERGYPVGHRPALGTPRYLAPERGEGQRGGPRSDIFSLGLIAYEMVCGETVFPALKGKGLLAAYRKTPVRLPPSELARFPEGFASLVEGMLEINPERRWDAERVIREVVRLQFEYRMGAQGRK